MKFIYPEFLVALLLIGIPILIHFLHFKRYKTVYFSQVNFLKTVKEESRKKNNLKQLLILLCRILTVAALVFVFSQPYFPTNKEAKNLAKKLVAIYVDNSFSMKQEGGSRNFAGASQKQSNGDCSKLWARNPFFTDR